MSKHTNNVIQGMRDVLANLEYAIGNQEITFTRDCFKTAITVEQYNREAAKVYIALAMTYDFQHMTEEQKIEALAIQAKVVSL